MGAVNIEELKEIMDNDMELIRDCFNDFLSDWPDMFADIQAAAIMKEPVLLNETAHRLKGTLKYLAAGPAADAAFAIEKAGSEKNFDTIEAKLAALEQACHDIVAYINSFQP